MKTILIYNTLTRKKEEIVPETDSLVRIYSCGLTVYDYPHIGNLRKYVFDDLLARTLKYFGYKVKNVMNITDVGHLTSDEDEGEDKIEKGARREGMSAFDVARHYEAAFLEDLKKLNIEKPEILCRATEHIKEQIDLIKILEEKGFTYKTSDGIYFDTSRSKDYGKLARLDLAGQKEGARVKINPEKKNPADFALWKFSYPNGRSFDSAQDDVSKKRQMEWESPWGIGFPGWHIECSAMSTKYLGQPFEIHTGGIDHISVHHTNEIAQSEAACGLPLAKYWVHSEHLLNEGRKMAKSEGGFLKLSDLEEKGYEALDFRYLCLSAHFQSKLNFSFDAMLQAKNSLGRVRSFAATLNDEEESDSEAEFYKKALTEFENKVADNLDTPSVIALIFSTIERAEKQGFRGRPAIDFFTHVDSVFVLDLFRQIEIPPEVKELVKNREELRKEGLYDQADEVRQQIEKQGFELEDLKDETRIIKK